jgi:hypothetical protein
VREIRMLRAMWRALETGLRNLLTGHEGGNAGHRQGVSFESPRQCSTLPRSLGPSAGIHTSYREDGRPRPRKRVTRKRIPSSFLLIALVTDFVLSISASQYILPAKI